MIDTAILTLAYILDLIIGDPGWLPHPVRIIGWLIEKMEKLCRGTARHAPTTEKLAGILLVIIIVGPTYGLFYYLNLFLLNPHLPKPVSYLAFTFLVYLVSTTIATNDLIKSGKDVITALNTGHKEEAKNKLGMIVGRDTRQLDNKGIAKATIETLAENTSDGIIAPLFYLAIGGLPLAMTYKAINTLDSMVGYRNEKYKNFGWASAKLDDIFNYIPARITGILIVVSAFIFNLFKNTHYSLIITRYSFKIMLRDGRKHLSPNSGIPEAAMAGALGVRLGGPSFYGGILVEKPYIGEEVPGVRSQEVGANGRSPVQSQDELLNASGKAVSIVKITSLLGLVCALMFQYLRIAICCK
jgi:adenosylcobinamide-phosphate synthase